MESIASLLTGKRLTVVGTKELLVTPPHPDNKIFKQSSTLNAVGTRFKLPCGDPNAVEPILVERSRLIL